jgi:hypothetical protein
MRGSFIHQPPRLPPRAADRSRKFAARRPLNAPGASAPRRGP